jgi:hypothetical protein
MAISLRRGACLLPRLDAGSPPRRAGNFGVHITSLREMSEPPLREHLLGQMKVTKAKPPRQHPISSVSAESFS